MGFESSHHQLPFFPSFIAATGGDEGRKKRNQYGDARNLGLMPANARGYMLSLLRSWFSGCCTCPNRNGFRLLLWQRKQSVRFVQQEIDVVERFVSNVLPANAILGVD